MGIPFTPVDGMISWKDGRHEASDPRRGLSPDVSGVR
jgi:hypothetical protein